MGSPVVTIYVRHSEDCKQTSEQYKRCNCRKHFRWNDAQGNRQRQPAGTRSWTEAEELKRKLEDSLSGTPPEAEETPKTIAEAVDLFLKEKAVSGISKAVQNRYARLLGRMQRHCEQSGAYTVQGVTRDMLTGFCATWPDLYASSYTRFRLREQLQGFIKFCYDSEWMRRKLPLPVMTIDEPPTMPLTPDEYARLLKAVPVAFPDAQAAEYTRALILLMRWTGLAIRDASTLERAEVIKDIAKGIYRVVTEREKTGTHVSVPLMPAVAEEILSIKSGNPKYIFFGGTTDPQAFASTCGQRIVKVFDAAGIVSEGNMKSHRLRDTFAVELLQAGVPMEEVSKLLGHESIRTTEKHYAKWVKGRQDRLDSLVTATWNKEEVAA